MAAGQEGKERHTAPGAGRGTPMRSQRPGPNHPQDTDKKEALVRPERFELPTFSFEGCRSIHLSYGRAWTSH